MRVNAHRYSGVSGSDSADRFAMPSVSPSRLESCPLPLALLKSNIVVEALKTRGGENTK